MPIRIRAEALGLPPVQAVQDFERLAIEAIDAGMQGVADGLKLELRQDARAAFPNSARIPTTIAGDYYPARNGKPPAVLIHPREGAGWLLRAHMGAEIAPRKKRVLAIPTAAVPKAPGGNGRKMRPAEVELRFGEKLDFMPARGGGKATGYLVLRRQTADRTGRVRRAAAGAPRRAIQARPAVMFILVPMVTLPARLRPAETIEKWAGLAPRYVEQAARRLGVG